MAAATAMTAIQQEELLQNVSNYYYVYAKGFMIS